MAYAPHGVTGLSSSSLFWSLKADQKPNLLTFLTMIWLTLWLNLYMFVFIAYWKAHGPRCFLQELWYKTGVDVCKWQSPLALCLFTNVVQLISMQLQKKIRKEWANECTTRYLEGYYILLNCFQTITVYLTAYVSFIPFSLWFQEYATEESQQYKVSFIFIFTFTWSWILG